MWGTIDRMRKALFTKSKHTLGVERRHAQVGPVSIHYQVAGSGAPLVLIHGLSGSCRWWGRNIDSLARQFHVYVVDLVGFGASRNGHPFVLDKAASTLVRWMDQVGIERAGLVGHSMGGHIAAELAADFPERVDRLMLVDAAVLPFDQNYLQHTFGLLNELRQLPLSFLPILFTDALRAGLTTLWRAASELLIRDMLAKLAKIQAPSLVVWGERDALLPLELGKQLARHMPGHELVVIKGAGHNPMWDCPCAFNQVVMDFMSANPRLPQRIPCSPARPALIAVGEEKILGATLKPPFERTA
jgi:pimeloyl-ACP methyl ester carboxylesterase